MKQNHRLKIAVILLVASALGIRAWKSGDAARLWVGHDVAGVQRADVSRSEAGREVVESPITGADFHEPAAGRLLEGETGSKGDSGLPGSLQEVFMGALHEIQAVTEEERKLPENEGALYFASNPKNQGEVRFLEDGAVRFSAKGETCAVWQGRRMNEVELERLGGPAVSGAEAKFHWSGGVSESFENVPEGLRHRIVLRERTEPADGGNLRLGIRLEDSMAQQDPAGGGIRITSRTASDVALHYGLPHVTDATGRALRASVSARGSQGFSIEVEDRAAVYPVNLGTFVTSEIRAAGLVDPEGRPLNPDGFGGELAFSGDTAVIGAAGDNTPLGRGAGSVYVFRRDRKGDWSLVKKVTPPQGRKGDAFGGQVSLSGDRFAVSAPMADPDGVQGAGCVWVFTRSGKDWVPEQRITSPSMKDSAFFGNEINLYEDRLIVSDPSSPSTGRETVYTYVRKPDGWQLESDLGDLPENTHSFGGAGKGLALSGDLAVVAGKNSMLEDGVFVFRRISETWTFETFLSPPENQGSYYFGLSLAISGNQILIGDPEDRRKSDRLETGCVYVYELTGSQWALKQEICPLDLNQYDLFGNGIAVSGSRAVFRATAINRSWPDSLRGRDFLFELEGGVWNRKATLTYPESRPGALRGSGMAISGDTALLRGGLTTVVNGNNKKVEGVDVVSVIRLTQEITVEVPPLAPFVSGQRLDDSYFMHVLGVGEKSTWTFDVRNTGMLPLEGLKTQIQSATPGYFSVKKELPQKIKPGDSAKVGIAFAPKMEGVHKATIRIFSNDANERPFELKVKGKAVVR